jgi:hypothetical protein
MKAQDVSKISIEHCVLALSYGELLTVGRNVVSNTVVP